MVRNDPAQRPHATTPPGVRPVETSARACTFVPPDTLSGVWPVSADMLAGMGVEAGSVTVVELGTDTLRSLVAAYAVEHAVGGGVPSFLVNESNTRTESNTATDPHSDFEFTPDGKRLPKDSDAMQGRLLHTSIELGLGAHPFAHGEETWWVLRQRQGAPVGCGQGAEYLVSTHLIVAGRNREREAAALCDALVAGAQKQEEDTFHLYHFHLDHGWCHQGKRSARPVESVVLPREAKEPLETDIEEFLSKETRLFYAKHGIPYKRAYLLWGPPGTGKSSLIQAIAGRWQRSVCVMQPTDPDLTDNMLREAVTHVPKRSMLVLEDIDALFTKGRENRGKSAVTFAGLLNALDGVGALEGQIFVLTTNHREQLDPALIRSGRVDLHVRFKYLVDEQTDGMFRRFFPSDAHMAPDFVAALRQVMGAEANTLSPAALQHYFIKQRKNSGADVVAHVADVRRELERRDEASTGAAAEGDEEEEAAPRRRSAQLRARSAAGAPETEAGNYGEVAAWLAQVGVASATAAALEEHGLDGAGINASSTDEVCAALGVTRVGERNKLRRAMDQGGRDAQ